MIPIPQPPSFENVQSQIIAVCREVESLLLEKNRAYGNSALSPVRIFSKADTLEQLKVRIDDKLSRMASSPTAFGEDVVLDLLGYLVLLRIAQRLAYEKPSPTTT